MNSHGLLLAARYACPPNLLSLCGPNRQSDLLYSLKTGTVTTGLAEILTEFSTLFPYLRFIASVNNIDDPFDPRVVQSYFVGNQLLAGIHMRDFGAFLTGDMQIQKRLTKPQIPIFHALMRQGTFPHHNHHVLTLYVRTGHDASMHTLQTINACIINWGKVINILSTSLTVLTRTIIYRDTTLCLSPPHEYTVRILSNPNSQKLRIGDSVSFHWGHVCARLSTHQVSMLKAFTYDALLRANALLRLERQTHRTE